MTDKKQKLKVEVITLYKARWHRNREDGRVATREEGPYLNYRNAQRVISRARKDCRDFTEGQVTDFPAIRISENIYNLCPVLEARIVKPSDLERIKRETVALKVGKRVLGVYSEPMNDQIKDYRAEEDK